MNTFKFEKLYYKVPLCFPRRQLENPGHYEDLENYYHSYKNCFLRNNYIPSPSLEKAPGLEEIPVLKVKIARYKFLITIWNPGLFESLPVYIKCVVPKSNHTCTWYHIGNSQGDGVSKAKMFMGKYKSKLEFPGLWEGEGLNQNPSMEWVNKILPRTTQCQLKVTL